MTTFQRAAQPETSPSVVIHVVEAKTGPARLRTLKTWISEIDEAALNVVDAAFERGGPWAGLDQLFTAVTKRLAGEKPDLLQAHAYELVRVAPSLGDTVETRYQSLTDTVPEEERVRLFPQDRALRIVHGLVDLLLNCVDKDILPAPLSLAWDRVDETSFMTRAFLAHLGRRLGPRIGVQLALGVTSEDGAGLESLFAEVSCPVQWSHLEVTEAYDPAPDSSSADEATRRLFHLERRVDEDPQRLASHLPKLVQAARLAGKPEKTLRWQAEAFSHYTFLGLYRDAWTYGEPVVAQLEEYVGSDELRRFKMLNKTFGCVGALGEPDALAQLPDFLIREGLECLEEPAYRGGVHYMLSMLHGRYLPDLDLDLAERHLEFGLEELKTSRQPEASRQFQIAFNRNGLALVRFRQGRAQEAIDLCRHARENLDRYLPDDQQRLHRSVLLYNIGQVYSSLGEDREAVEHLNQAIELDPEYSEYYNDRGMLHFKAGRLTEAREDYLRAIRFSPPYPEVWTNLGQCLRRMAAFADALQAYNRSLDLDPHQPLAWAGRADCHQELGDLSLAENDYSAALERAPKDWECLGNRAVVRYSLGRPEEALADLEKAVRLAPDVPDLRQNRAVALADLGHRERAREDLEHYLHLAPGAADRQAVAQRIEELASP